MGFTLSLRFLHVQIRGKDEKRQARKTGKRSPRDPRGVLVIGALEVNVGGGGGAPPPVIALGGTAAEALLNPHAGMLLDN